MGGGCFQGGLTEAGDPPWTWAAPSCGLESQTEYKGETELSIHTHLLPDRVPCDGPPHTPAFPATTDCALELQTMTNPSFSGYFVTGVIWYQAHCPVTTANTRHRVSLLITWLHLLLGATENAQSVLLKPVPSGGCEALGPGAWLQDVGHRRRVPLPACLLPPGTVGCV